MNATALTEAETLARADVEAGIGRLLPATEDGGFSLDARFAGAEGQISNGRFTAVAWLWTGRHELPFQGLTPTMRTVALAGVTLVEQAPGGEPTFHRYVDWISLYGQLGVSMTGLPIVPSDSPRPVQ